MRFFTLIARLNFYQITGDYSSARKFIPIRFRRDLLCALVSRSLPWRH